MTIEAMKQAQEPGGWFTEDHREDKSATTYSKKMAERWKEKGWPVTPLYTTPPTPRQWVGLTEEEKRYLNEVLNLQGRFPVIDAIEAKLREKNT